MPLPREQVGGVVLRPETAWRRALESGTELKLPRTIGRRGGISFIQALRGVAGRPKIGFGLEGRFFKAGAWIAESELGRGPDLDVVLCECTEVAGESHSARRGRNWEALYIIWRWNGDRGEWEEVARSTGERTLVMAEVRAAAERALQQRSWRIVPTVEQAAERIRDTLERQIAGVEREQRAAVLAILHDQVTAMMVGEWG